MESSIDPNIKLSLLSFNILGNILEFLNYREICVLGATCKRLKLASEMDILWSQSLEAGDTGKEKKRVFLSRGNITQNIFNGSYQTYLFEGHSKTVTRIATKENLVLSASADGTARLWDTAKMTSRVLAGHSDAVISAKFCGEKIVTASTDKTVRIWTDEDEPKILRGHTQGISALQKIDEDRVITGSYDKTVKIWNVNKGKCVANYNDHSTAVYKVFTEDNLFASCAHQDDKAFVRDMALGEIVQVFGKKSQPQAQRWGPPQNEIRSLYLSAPLFFTGEINKIRVWDLRSPVQAGETQVISPIKNMNVKEQNSNGIFKMIYSQFSNLMLVGCMGLLGLLAFDMRSFKKSLYVPSHDYPILAFDSGEKVLNNIAVTSGTTTNYRYELSVHDLSSPQEICTKFVPGHKAVITSICVGEDIIVSGSKNGSLRGLCFRRNRNALRRANSGNSFRIRSVN